MMKYKIWLLLSLMTYSGYLAAAHMDGGAGSNAMELESEAKWTDHNAMDSDLPQHPIELPPTPDAGNLGNVDHNAMDSDLPQHPIELPPTPDAGNLGNVDHNAMDSDLTQHPIELPSTPIEVEPVLDPSPQNFVQAELPQNAPAILAQDFAPARRKRVKVPKNVSPILVNLAPPEQIASHLAPLALHLVNFQTHAPAANQDIIRPKHRAAQALATPGVDDLVQKLHFLGVSIDLLKACNEAPTQGTAAQIAPATTADTFMGSNVTIVDASDVAGVAESPFIVNMWKAMTDLRQVMPDRYVKLATANLVSQLKAMMPTDQFNNLFYNEKHLRRVVTNLFVNLLNGILPDQIPEYITYLERIQVELLKGIDRLLPPMPANSFRCLTWMVSSKPNGTENVFPPYATMIYPQGGARQPVHIMFYNFMGPYFADDTVTLKVVVDNYLCEIPFEVQIPPDLLSMSVVIVAIPQTQLKEDGTTEITGVKVVIYGYSPHDIGQQPASWAFQLN